MTDLYYCSCCDWFIMMAAGDEQDPRCPHCNQPVDHMGDSDPTAYDTIEEMKGR